MDKKIISVEYQIPGHSEQYYEYSSDQSLLDADIIVFRPQQFYDGSGKASFDESESYDIQRSSKHWRTELVTALEYGKTVFLILGKYQLASIRTGKTEVKGSKVINYVANYDNYQFVPIPLPPMTAKTGTEMIFTGDPVFATFWKEFKAYLKYASYLNEKVQRPIYSSQERAKNQQGPYSKLRRDTLYCYPY